MYSRLATLVERRLEPGVVVKPTPSWAAKALLEELIMPVWIAVGGRCACRVAGKALSFRPKWGVVEC